MEKEFWKQLWVDNTIPFHKSEAHPFLVKHFDQLHLDKGARIFIPLCGKTLDIGWLMKGGFHVIGAELSPLAIDQLFDTLGITPTITKTAQYLHYQAELIDIFVGDLFDLSNKEMGKVDAVYDRGSLVALPQEMRIRYTKHLMQITDHAPQLLITYQYDQAEMDGPPFAISDQELNMHYAAHYHIQKCDARKAGRDLSDRPFDITEIIWMLNA